MVDFVDFVDLRFTDRGVTLLKRLTQFLIWFTLFTKVTF